MGKQAYHVGERIHFYLPTDQPKRDKPRTGVIVEILGSPQAGSAAYAIVREETVSGVESDQVIALLRESYE